MLTFANLAFADSKQKADDAIKAASSANRDAKKVSFEWRDTGKMIKKAKDAIKDKNYKKALNVAKKAHRQAIKAQEQALDQANPTPRYQS